MANNIDTLMDLYPDKMTKDDIDAIIAYHRQNRAHSEAGIKPKKETGPKVKLDLEAMGLIKPKPPAITLGKRRL